MKSKVITLDNKSYPERLRNIFNPPKQLFIKTLLSDEEFKALTDQKIIAVVGSRQVTPYGRKVTTQLTTELVKKGYTIVSGLARGVDGIAHQAALDAGGKTIAVLGTGIDDIYPWEHEALYNSILERGGAIISEWPGKVAIHPRMFLIRNRITAGISEAVLVTEAAIRSGSLNIARQAVEQGKEVFAVPGPIDSLTSEGTNFLIEQGARPVMDINGIF